MSKLTHWVFREVCHSTQIWLDEWKDARIGLNISPVDLRDDSLLGHVEAMLTRYAIPANVLQVEVTESHALTCDDAMLSRLTRLTRLTRLLVLLDMEPLLAHNQH